VPEFVLGGGELVVGGCGASVLGALGRMLAPVVVRDVAQPVVVERLAVRPNLGGASR
jgi:hypothetical protein